MTNQIFDGTKGWREAPAEAHPSVILKISTEKCDYDHLCLPFPPMKPTNQRCITDSGCQSCLLGLKMFYRLGLKKKDLVPVRGKMSAINGEGIDVAGAIFLRLTGFDIKTGKTVQTAVMAYMSDSTEQFYISKQAMRELGIIPVDFPSVKAAAVTSGVAPVSTSTAECGCPRHQQPPERPSVLPFEPIPANIGKMKAWLLETFRSSLFNDCPHQQRPTMDTEPMRIHIKPDASPKAVYTAATVPIHWRKDVEEQLKQDVDMGIIEPVPIGTPTTWQARMHVVPKQSGDPRRTVDLRALNSNCVRETQHVVPPYKQARLVPARTWRTVTDCKNGYHSCPLSVEDRPKTTFITEQGRFQYCVAPQGFVASGDAYNRRYDEIIAGIENKTKCVDDVLKWDEVLEKHWWEIIDYLILVGKNGIVLNPNKFQFCQRDVEFAGFLLT